MLVPTAKQCTEIESHRQCCGVGVELQTVNVCRFDVHETCRIEPYESRVTAIMSQIRYIRRAIGLKEDVLHSIRRKYFL